MKIYLLLLIVILSSPLTAQELNCVVDVNARQVEGSEKVMFDEMQKAIFQLVNGRKWTNHKYEVYERIDCSILINLQTRISNTEFSGNIQVQAIRPIYNTSYKSPIMNIRDEDFKIRYNQFEPLQFNESSYSGELTTIIAFYVYMILAYDHDSYALEGGTPYFKEAQRVVNNAQASRETGWRSGEDRKNRYWLLENALNTRFDPLRQAYYEYHINGFDKMHQNMEQARNNIRNALKELRKIHNVEPSSYNLQVFFNAKAQELIKLFEKASPSEKQEMADLLILIDPGNSAKYEKMRK